MEEERYHLDCFRCSKCQVVLDNNYYVGQDGKFVCPTDYLVGGLRPEQLLSRPLGDAAQVPSLPSPDQGEDPADSGG